MSLSLSFEVKVRQSIPMSEICLAIKALGQGSRIYGAVGYGP
jgi:hypothetical protein